MEYSEMSVLTGLLKDGDDGGEPTFPHNLKFHNNLKTRQIRFYSISRVFWLCSLRACAVMDTLYDG